MEQSPALASPPALQIISPSDPGGLVPGLRWPSSAGFFQIAEVFAHRLDLAFDDAPPWDDIKEGRKIAAHRKPESFGLVAKDVMSGEPVAHGLEGLRMKRARREAREFSRIEFRRRPR